VLAQAGTGTGTLGLDLGPKTACPVPGTGTGTHGHCEPPITSQLRRTCAPGLELQAPGSTYGLFMG
jgi:hypothetical protein